MRIDVPRGIIVRMYPTRKSLTLARLILAWFVLGLGVGIASPIVNPLSMIAICSTGGDTSFVVVDRDGVPVETAPRTIDCPMCLPAMLPPVALRFDPVRAGPSRVAHTPSEVPGLPESAGAPLPARGPPALT